ncbi:MAG: hypothetical protein ABL959_05770 [Pyrinomonadaceae bacterium]
MSDRRYAARRRRRDADSCDHTSAEPTLVLPATAPAKERSKLPLIIAAAIGMFILMSVSYLLLTKTAEKGNAVRENQNLRKQAASQTPTPRPAS